MGVGGRLVLEIELRMRLREMDGMDGNYTKFKPRIKIGVYSD